MLHRALDIWAKSKASDSLSPSSVALGCWTPTWQTQRGRGAPPRGNQGRASPETHDCRLLGSLRDQCLTLIPALKVCPIRPAPATPKQWGTLPWPPMEDSYRLYVPVSWLSFHFLIGERYGIWAHPPWEGYRTGNCPPFFGNRYILIDFCLMYKPSLAPWERVKAAGPLGRLHHNMREI